MNWIELNECHKCGLNILYDLKVRLASNFGNCYEMKVLKTWLPSNYVWIGKLIDNSIVEVCKNDV